LLTFCVTVSPIQLALVTTLLPSIPNGLINPCLISFVIAKFNSFAIPVSPLTVNAVLIPLCPTIGNALNHELNCAEF